MIRWTRVFVVLVTLGALGLASVLGERLGAQATPPATGQPGPVQPAPPREVSPVTPRGPIRLTATPPKIATPEPAANGSTLTARYVGSLACQRCHAATYERWSHTRMANVITDPKANPSVVLGDFSKPNPLVNFKLEDVAFVVRHEMEAALLPAQRQRLLSGECAVGRHQPHVAHLSRAAEHRVVAAALPREARRQLDAADRSAVRRVPFDELRRADQARHRMERRLRALPRPRQRARRPPGQGDHHRSVAAQLRRGKRRVPAVPHAGQARRRIPHNGQYYDWPVGFHVGLGAEGFLDARRAASW